MSEFENVEKIYRCIRKVHKNFALLHCVSAYPPPPSEINLNVINLYKQKFPDVIIGYSGHEVGIGISIAAVTMGAKVSRFNFYTLSNKYNFHYKDYRKAFHIKQDMARN